ncbi:MAG: FkbM family methyltransferase [Bacteroidetes bacterium]|nr:FkbM family methyltransferase [Bacteroidota bacterium]
MKKIKKLWRMFFPGKQTKRVKPWFEADGDNTLRLNYNLSEHSVVVDLGGYKGQWASDIYGMYRCNVFVFEPARKFFHLLCNRFAKNDNIKIFNYALGNKNDTELIFMNADSSSTIKMEGTPEEITFKRFDETMKELGIGHIDLIKINIEGGEYDLLDYLIETGWTNKIDNIQVQFHDFFPNAQERMRKIQTLLGSSHFLTYQFEFVWENWQRKSF